MSLKSISDQFRREYGVIIYKALAEIARDISDKSPEEVADFIRSVFKKHGVDIKTQKVMFNYIIKGAAFGIGAKSIASPIAFKKTYLDKVYDSQGVKLSSRLHDLSRHDELISALKEAARGKESWNLAAQAIFKKGIEKADIATDISSLMSKARKVFRLSDDSDAYVQYRREVGVAQRRIDRLINPDTSKLKRAYQSVLDITNKSSIQAVESTVKYAGYFKEKYNTERLTTTELSRAYGQARIVEMQSNDDVVGIRVVLNSQHSGRDICDFYAESDFYGLGPGGFPKDHMPPYPFHPWDMCKLEEIYAGEFPEKTASDFDPKQGEKYLNRLSVDDRKELLGVSGNESFSENPKKWREYLKGYNDPVKVKAKIPLEVLQGK
jgi:hypothetical protein